MAKVANYGPNGTAVAGVSSITLPIAPLNFDADFGVVQDEPGKVVMTDVTSPVGRPALVRIATRERANIYAGSNLDPGVYLPVRSGTDKLVEVTMVVEVTDPADPSYLKLFPVRLAVTSTLPRYADVDMVALEKVLLTRAIAAMAAQGASTLDTGLAATSRGVLTK